MKAGEDALDGCRGPLEKASGCSCIKISKSETSPGQQVELLAEEIRLRSETEVVFLKLTPLVGG